MEQMRERDFSLTQLEYAPECQLERLVEHYPDLPLQDSRSTVDPLRSRLETLLHTMAHDDKGPRP